MDLNDGLSPQERTELRDTVLAGAQRIRKADRRRRQILAGSVAVALVGAIAGGAVTTMALVDPRPPAPASTSTPTQTSGPTPAPEPTRTPTPTPDPTATADPDDPSTWIISEDGMGPLVLAVPFPEAVAAMPEATMTDAENCSWTAWWNSPDQSHQVFVSRASDGPADGPVTVVAVASLTDDPAAVDGPRTAEGIGVGSSVAEVRAAYPDAVEVTDSIDSSIVHLRAGRMFFSYRAEPIITEVTVTTLPAPPYEVCG